MQRRGTSLPLRPLLHGNRLSRKKARGATRILVPITAVLVSSPLDEVEGGARATDLYRHGVPMDSSQTVHCTPPVVAGPLPTHPPTPLHQNPLQDVLRTTSVLAVEEDTIRILVGLVSYRLQKTEKL